MKREMGYKTLETFEGIKNYKFPVFLRENLILISNLQVNIHTINSPTLPHSHTDFQMIYYLKGGGIEKSGKKMFDVSPGTIVFIPPERKHGFLPYPQTSAEVFTMRFEVIRNISSVQ